MALPKIPLNIKTVTRFGKLLEEQASSEMVIDVLVDLSADQRLISLSRRVLEICPGTSELAISGFSEAMPELNREADLIIVIAGSSSYLRRIMEISLWSDRNCVVLTQDAAGLVASVPEEDAFDIARTILEVDVAQPQEVLERQLADWCMRNVPELRLALAKAFLFMRQPVSADFTKQTAIENAVIAAVFFLPGADLPILTLNQCKLLYQIAVANEVPLSRERLVDLSLVVLLAFGLRGVSRVVTHKIGVLAWLARGCIAFGATMVLGHVGYSLYSRGGGVVELLQGRLGDEAKNSEHNTFIILHEDNGLQPETEADHDKADWQVVDGVVQEATDSAFLSGHLVQSAKTHLSSVEADMSARDERGTEL